MIGVSTARAIKGDGGRLFESRRFTKSDFEKGLAEIAAGLRAAIEADVDGFPTDAEASKTRRTRGFEDFAFFAKTYFPHYVKAAPSAMHRWVYDEVPRIAKLPKGARTAIAAPRGEAKSTLFTQLHTLWRLARLIRLHELEKAKAPRDEIAAFGKASRFVIIAMDASDQANGMLEAIKAELEVNPRLRTDYPEMCGTGRVWREGLIVTTHGARVDAVGSGKKLRGKRHGPYRPDLVILDDIENDENVESIDQRDKLTKWVDRAVGNLGPPDGTMDIVYVGTLLHYDSVLARKLANPAWRTAKFQAMPRLPDRTDLWDRWEEMFRNEGEDAADAFFAANREAMLAGAEVSWPEVRGVERLMKIKIEVGPDAFAAEFQNDPLSLKDAPFGTPVFWVARQRDWLMFGACDPSLGKEDRPGDPSAILVGAFEPHEQIVDVVEASIRRRLPDTIGEDIIALQLAHKCLAWGIETVQFQHFFAQTVLKKAKAKGVTLPVRALVPTVKKEIRIMSLQPYWANRQIRLHPSQKTLIDQARHYPKVPHDDGLDGLQMLWIVATSFMRIGDVMTAARADTGTRAGYGGARARGQAGARRIGMRVGGLYGGA